MEVQYFILFPVLIAQMGTQENYICSGLHYASIVYLRVTHKNTTCTRNKTKQFIFVSSFMTFLLRLGHFFINFFVSSWPTWLNKEFIKTLVSVFLLFFLCCFPSRTWLWAVRRCYRCITAVLFMPCPLLTSISSVSSPPFLRSASMFMRSVPYRRWTQPPAL